jgi:hypothetical protein
MFDTYLYFNEKTAGHRAKPLSTAAMIRRYSPTKPTRPSLIQRIKHLATTISPAAKPQTSTRKPVFGAK